MLLLLWLELRPLVNQGSSRGAVVFRCPRCIVYIYYSEGSGCTCGDDQKWVTIGAGTLRMKLDGALVSFGGSV